MLRVRFKANAEDWRPIEWPPKHPYWCTGYGCDDEDNLAYATLVSYADDEDYIRRMWPEATDLDSYDVEGYTFTDRFPKPGWFNTEERA